MLRATILCFDGAGVLAAWKRCEAGFNITDDHGRLKNSFNTAAVPMMLLNVQFDVPECLPVVAEIQIRRREHLPAGSVHEIGPSVLT